MEITTEKMQTYKLTDELFRWMYGVCKNYLPRESLADVYIAANGYLYAADGYRMYCVPNTMIDRDCWYSSHDDRFGSNFNFNENTTRLPCARADVSSKRYLDPLAITGVGFEILGAISTRELWIQCHDVLADAPKVYYGYIMPILESKRYLNAEFVRDMLSMPHLLGNSIEVSVAASGTVRFEFECEISAYIMPVVYSGYEASHE